jgi:hypothetical protein
MEAIEPASRAPIEPPARALSSLLALLARRGWASTAVLLATLDAGVWLMGWRIFNPDWGTDYRIHVAAAARWLETGSPFFPIQLNGPYELALVHPDPILYPPTILPLFAAFTVLPALLWWAIPIAIVAGIVAYRRPSWIQLVVIALLVAWPQSIVALGVGNPVMWIAAALALGTVVPGFSPLVFLKPSLAPLALWNVHRRGWWLGLAVLVLVSIPFGALWGEWLTALFNARQSQGLFYSAYQVPLLLIPLVPVVRWPERLLPRR